MNAWFGSSIWLAVAVTVAAWIVVTAGVGLLFGRWMRGTVTVTEPPAGGEDPAVSPRTAPDSPLPGPPPPLRRLIYREDRLACGCIYIYDLGAGHMIRDVCAVCSFDPDAWNQRLTQ